MGKRATKVKFLEERYDKKAFGVLPKNQRQDDLMRSIEKNTLTVAMGFAGTGKTYCAAMIAAKLLLKGDVNKIILTRANVPTGKSLGYFPGTIEEKLIPWLAPMLSVLREGLGEEDLSCRFGKSVLVQPLETIRGNSFNDAIILVDEAQNLTFEEIKALTTRIGYNSKLVLMGDPNQSDVAKGTAIMKFASLCNRNNINVPVIQFEMDDIVRSDVVADLVKMFYKENI